MAVFDPVVSKVVPAPRGLSVSALLDFERAL